MYVQPVQIFSLMLKTSVDACLHPLYDLNTKRGVAVVHGYPSVIGYIRNNR